MTVPLNPELAERVRAEAMRRGIDADSLVQSIIDDALQFKRPAASRQERLAATRRMRVNRAKYRLGPDLTIRQLLEEGRRH